MKEDKLCIILGILGFCGLAVAGSLLVYYNYITICDDCKSGFNSTIINNVKSCIIYNESIIYSYEQCYIHYRQPGFGFGIFFLVICWLVIGAPVIVVVDF